MSEPSEPGECRDSSHQMNVKPDTFSRLRDALYAGLITLPPLEDFTVDDDADRGRVPRVLRGTFYAAPNPRFDGKTWPRSAHTARQATFIDRNHAYGLRLVLT